ncbi:hypothetical protein LTR10_021523 [Elasticomyces elasticus]|uniref:Uncharacterized protein n=1 Tax=Exophiala sideris TaxID=1016849 RepID=A0ABR0J992_9EURO|nr:hypothetical protein LTR10_021523 [Elasticomyces elasticus]KAK5027979.1 hypothetical protein LTS07_006855 [Exophiala sideris]KAK5037430.1 hypothetical protein LTR13_004587 [Exophiala sideris]KAK5059092.1 hypothetical protein LTR69_006381 [Exophiala sideris]KAK5182925.1 hypothetical protein LTR44_004635 [Eurotiomycetes sp. CCFEE 6388]
MDPLYSSTRDSPAPGLLARGDDPAIDALTQITKHLRTQSSDATLPYFGSAGKDKTPRDTLQLPHYDKPKPTLVAIPANIRLRILKYAFPHQIRAVISTDVDSPRKHYLWDSHEGFWTRHDIAPGIQDGLALGFPLPPFLNCCRQLYEEGFEAIEGFKLSNRDSSPTQFERYPRILQKNTKVIRFEGDAIWNDFALLFTNFGRLRDLDFSYSIAPGMWLSVDWMGYSLGMTREIAAKHVWLESPIPNPDEGDFTERVLPRFSSQGRRLFRDHFYDAVYKNNIKITFSCLLGRFKPSQTGSPHEFEKFDAIAVGSAEYVREFKANH